MDRASVVPGRRQKACGSREYLDARVRRMREAVRLYVTEIYPQTLVVLMTIALAAARQVVAASCSDVAKWSAPMAAR